MNDHSLVNDIFLDLGDSPFEFADGRFTFRTGNSDLDRDKVWIGMRIHVIIVFCSWSVSFIVLLKDGSKPIVITKIEKKVGR